MATGVDEGFAVGRYWKRHPKKDLEALLGEFYEAGWRIEDPPTYYTVKCPCGDHMRQIHLTPSNPDYAKNALNWLYRQPCYGKGTDQWSATPSE